MSKLILLRHGESIWNKLNRFTGWTNVGLTEKGEAEAQEAGVILRNEGIAIDIAFSSELVRATETLRLVLEKIKQTDIPTSRTWVLNERHYGFLQGLYKDATAEEYGEEQVFEWRRSFNTRPPAIGLVDERHPVNDPLYADVKRDVLPSTESLADVVTRVVPFWREYIAPELRQGKTVLIAAHGNTVRAIIKYLDNISEDDIAGYDIPYAVPLLYEFNEQLEVESSRYLGDEEKIKETIAAIQKQGKID